MEQNAPEFKSRTSSTGWLEGLNGRRVYIETYGCRYNFGDTAKLIEILKALGCTFAGSAEDAEAVIINTCTVVGPSERRMLRRLSNLRNCNLYVTGCMPSVQQDAIHAVCTPMIIPHESIHDLYSEVGTITPDGAGIVQIAQGCMGQCTYCITRFARGPLKSFPEPEILTQVRAHAEAGTAEIQITAQDVSAWGKDCGKSLDGLLARISEIPGRYRVRVGMMNPATVKDHLDKIADALSHDPIFRFIHLPVQSGSDSVLERMRRGYTVAEFEEIVAVFRRKIPDITLMTDMIVGFPGETEEDFSRSLELIDRVLPNKVNITRYSPRPLTGPFPDKEFPDSVKKDRSRIMQARAEALYFRINQPYLNTEVPFMVTETIRAGSVMARTPTYTGVVINEELPVGYEGRAILKKDRRYFFIGSRVE